MSKVELVIYDMDGLMIDTEYASQEGWRVALAHYGFEMTNEFFSQLLGRSLSNNRNLMINHYGTTLDFEAVFERRMAFCNDYFREHGYVMKKGLLYSLDRVEQLGIKKCIATSTEQDSMEKKLEGLNLLPRFDGCITGDQVKEVKPNPEIFLKAARLFGIDPENCLVLEDSPAGVTAGHAAGMRVIMVPDMAQPDEELVKKLYAICEDLEEAAELISRICLTKQ